MIFVDPRVLKLKTLAATALAVLMALPATASAQSFPPPPPTIPGLTFTVNTSDDVDDGVCNATHCSFREAINAVNARSTSIFFHIDAIVFDLPLVARIDCVLNQLICQRRLAPSPIVTSGLPALADNMIIDGTTQSFYNGTPVVEVRGANTSTVGLSLKRSASGASIRGLSITNFDLAGIDDRAENSVITGNFIGLDPSGAVRGNGVGILVSGANATVGGSTAAARNVISGNIGDGVQVCDCSFNHLDDGTGANIRVLGNYIGTNVAGTAALGNQIGVHVLGPGFNTQFGVCNPGVVNTSIASGNVISGNRSTGVAVDECAWGTTVNQNRIGTNAAATAAVANAADGVKVTNAGATIVSSNVVSGNAHDGVNLSINGLPANSVLGNKVGTDSTGNQAIPNLGNGVTISGFPGTDGHNTLGDQGANANIIANNGGAGVRETSSGGTAMRFNSIHDNVGLGIDIGGAGVTPNQVFYNGGVPNFPVLDSARTSSAGLTIGGHLRNQAGRAFTLDFYSSPACDGSGSGEGRTYLGSTTVTLDAASNGTSEKSFNVTFAATTVAVGNVITATTTDHFPFTSEFSACESVTAS